MASDSLQIIFGVGLFYLRIFAIELRLQESDKPVPGE